MKLMGRTDSKSYLNGYKGEGWAEVKECYKNFPTGRRLCVEFPDGYIVKADRCELAYVFEK